MDEFLFDLSKVTAPEKEVSYTTYSCSDCKLYANCTTPKIAPFGEGRLGILIILDSVSKPQDGSNNTRQGVAYNYLRAKLADIGISLNKDCWTVNAIRCHSEKTEYGTKTMSACSDLLLKDIQKLKPKVIIPTCKLALDVLLYSRERGRASNATFGDFVGYQIPDQTMKTWILPIYEPNEVSNNEDFYQPYFNEQLESIKETISTPFPTYDISSGVQIASNVEEAIPMLREVLTWKAFAFDYETNAILPYRKETKIKSISFSNGEKSFSFLWYPNNDMFMQLMREVFTNSATRIAHNSTFEWTWTMEKLGINVEIAHDPMQAQHIIHNQKKTNLKFLTYVHFGHIGYDNDMSEFIESSKEDKKKFGNHALNRIDEAPVRPLLQYGGVDSLVTYWLMKKFLSIMDEEHEKTGYEFFMDNLRALDEASYIGFRIDTAKMDESIPRLQARVDALYKEIIGSDLIQFKWLGGRFNPTSDADVRSLVYNILKMPVVERTESGLPSVDEDALSLYKDDIPLLVTLLEYRSVYKILNTFIMQIKRETWEGTIHPSYMLHLVKTFRSSCIAKGTPVLVNRDYEKYPNGVPIEEIKVGDMVLCYDNNKNPTFRKVLWAGKTGHRNVVRVHYIGNSGKRGYVDMTPEHRVMAANGEWVEAQNLTAGNDYRNRNKAGWKHTPKPSVMSMHREQNNHKDRIYCTGFKDAFLEHRVAWESVNGAIPDGHHIHHKDHNHCNHTLSNLECMPEANHIRHHLMVEGRGFSNTVIHQKAIEKTKELRALGVLVSKTGIENPLYIQLSKHECMVEFFRVRGKVRESQYGYEVFNRELRRHNIPIDYIKQRFNLRGEYVSKWRLFRILKEEGLNAQGLKSIGFNRASVLKLMDLYGIGYQRGYKNQMGFNIPRQVYWNNHKIDRIEYLEEPVDVYDLEVEEFHNFIAGELCVHNCSNPNWQNLPSRNEEAVEEVKSLILPLPGHKLAEYDQSGLEMRGAGVIANDERIAHYIMNPGTADMHKNSAVRLFMLPEEVIEKHKSIRSTAKTINFAMLYGSFYKLIAAMSWKQMTSPKALKDFGMDLLGHIKSKGIHTYEEWEAHCQRFEDFFWNQEFKTLHQYRKRTYNEFKATGKIYYVTGFTYSGPASRNAACNAPIQGASFHINLYTIGRLHREIKKKGLKSRLVGQVHDSILISVHPDEEEIIDYLVYYYGTVQVRKVWKWITLPLEIEKSITPEVDQPWSMKQKQCILDGKKEGI